MRPRPLLAAPGRPAPVAGSLCALATRASLQLGGSRPSRRCTWRTNSRQPSSWRTNPSRLASGQLKRRAPSVQHLARGQPVQVERAGRGACGRGSASAPSHRILVGAEVLEALVSRPAPEAPRRHGASRAGSRGPVDRGDAAEALARRASSDLARDRRRARNRGGVGRGRLAAPRFAVRRVEAELAARPGLPSCIRIPGVAPHATRRTRPCDRADPRAGWPRTARASSASPRAGAPRRGPSSTSGREVDAELALGRLHARAAPRAPRATASRSASPNGPVGRDEAHGDSALAPARARSAAGWRAGARASACGTAAAPPSRRSRRGRSRAAPAPRGRAARARRRAGRKRRRASAAAPRSAGAGLAGEGRSTPAPALDEGVHARLATFFGPETPPSGQHDGTGNAGVRRGLRANERSGCSVRGKLPRPDRARERTETARPVHPGGAPCR